MTKYVSHCFVRYDGKNKAMQTQAAAAFHLNEQQPAVSSLLNPVKCNGQSLAPGLDLYWMHTLCFFFLNPVLLAAFAFQNYDLNALLWQAHFAFQR